MESNENQCYSYFKEKKKLIKWKSDESNNLNYTQDTAKWIFFIYKPKNFYLRLSDEKLTN